MNPLWGRQSLRNKFIVIFLAIMIPIIFFLYYSTHYGENTIRSQSVQLNKNLLTMYQREMDRSMRDVELYLYNLNDTDLDLRSIDMYTPASADYILAKYAVLKRFKNDSGYFKKADDFFLYLEGKNDFVSLRSGRQSLAENKRREGAIRAFIQGGKLERWSVLEGTDTLTRVLNLGGGVYLGASIGIDKLVDPLDIIEIGERGRMLLLSGEGRLLTQSGVTAKQTQQLKSAVGSPAAVKAGYAILPAFKDGENYIGVSQSSSMSDLHVIIVMPEGEVLKALHFFERAIEAIPPVAIALIILYILILQQVLIKPLRRIIKGMRGISRGDLTTRLSMQGTRELVDVTHAFNNMADQIERLKIDVYEEQLKVQKAEYMRLQVQINPHFYLNSLNIIYNLAVVKSYASIQSMALHLGSYFRFIMQHNRSTVTLAQELEHTRNYLEIQRLRFPDILTFEIKLIGGAEDMDVPPLTIQPLVENCMVHGLRDIDEPFHIQVTAGYTGDGSLLIEIADNGCGFSTEMLVRLGSKAFLEGQENEHIGVRNLYQRFCMRFGPHVQMTCANEGLNGGAVVRLHVPAEWAMKEGVLSLV